MRQAARRRVQRRGGDRRHRDVTVAEDRRWLPCRRCKPRRGGLDARLHRYNG
jgi:hypothetical protein